MFICVFVLSVISPTVIGGSTLVVSSDRSSSDFGIIEEILFIKIFTLLEKVANAITIIPKITNKARTLWLSIFLLYISIRFLESVIIRLSVVVCASKESFKSFTWSIP